ncbi:MAG: hypothetical protein HOI95_04725 [Chromatiales bacterium]|jgi:protein O-GlcNAc transferase|nr:hypothetical protein [Chromatiales bacterium]
MRHTQDARLGIFAARPASIQTTHLGFPGTTGACYFDYLLADAWTVPESHEAHVCEHIIRLPFSYQVNDSSPDIASLPNFRAEAGLPDDVFVFACFNQGLKIENETFLCWMRMLKAVPHSVLLLLPMNSLANGNFRVTAMNNGVSAERLIFANIVNRDIHLKRIEFASLALDTWT